MKYLIVVIAFIGMSMNSTAQSYEVPMTMESRFGSSAHFFQGYRKLKKVQVKNVMKSNATAYASYRKGKAWYNTGSAMVIVGGLGFGAGIVGYIATKDAPYLIGAGAGVLMMGTSIPIYKKGDTYMKQAVGIHNEGVRKYSFWDQKELRFIGTSNGLGLAFRF